MLTLTLSSVLACSLLPLGGAGILLTLLTERWSDETRFKIIVVLILVMVGAIFALN